MMERVWVRSSLEMEITTDLALAFDLAVSVRLENATPRHAMPRRTDAQNAQNASRYPGGCIPADVRR